MSTKAPPVPVHCLQCSNQIGEEINVGVVLLHAGGGLWRELRGYCTQCGKPFYWTASDNQMEVIIKVARVGIQSKTQERGKDG